MSDEQSDLLHQMWEERRIVRLKLAFARAADDGDPDAMVAAFAESVEVSYSPDEPMSGRGEVLRWYREKLGPVVASSHHLTNFEVDVRGDEATMHCYLYSWQRFHPDADRPDRHRWARYVDRLRKVDGRWEITSLQLLSGGETPSMATERDGEYRRLGFGSVTHPIRSSSGSTA